MNQHITMPIEVQEYFNTVNQYQPEQFIALFDDNASVTDNGREVSGTEAIQAWGEAELFSAKVRYAITEIEGAGQYTLVTAEADREFIKPNLPNPLLVKLKFKVNNGKITGLILTHS